METIKNQAAEIERNGLQITGMLFKIETTGITNEKVLQCSKLTDEIANRAKTIVAEAEKLNTKVKETQNIVSSLRKELAITKHKLFLTQEDERRVEASNKKLKEDLDNSQEIFHYFFDDNNNSPKDNLKGENGAAKSPADNVDINKEGATDIAADSEDTNKDGEDTHNDGATVTPDI